MSGSLLLNESLLSPKRKELLAKFKEIYLNNLQKYIDNSTYFGILFSGGMDSLSTLLGSRIALNRKPSFLLNFHHWNHLSKDTKIAKKIAKTIDTNLVVFQIRYGLPDYGYERLQEDVIQIIQAYGAKKKTVIECSTPMLDMFKQYKHEGFMRYFTKADTFLSGYYADVLFGVQKKPQIHFREDHRGFNQYREDLVKWSYDVPGSDFQVLRQIVADYCYGAKVESPFHEKNMIDLLLQYNWKELNFPYPKWLIVYTFGYWFLKHPWAFRRHESLQLESGLRDIHLNLLRLPQNRKYKTVQLLYNDLKRQYGVNKN